MNDEQVLSQSQAVNVLIQAARISQSKGAFTLEDAELVSRAIKALIPPSQKNEVADDSAINSQEVVDLTQGDV